MDPDVALAMLRSAVQRVLSEGASDREARRLGLEVAGQFTALDEWLSQGGFPPAAWAEARADE